MNKLVRLVTIAFFISLLFPITRVFASSTSGTEGFITVGGSDTTEWVGGSDVSEWVGAEKSISNSPSSKDFGIVKPLTTYYAYGSAPSNPVTDAQCSFTITNGSASPVNIAMSCSNATGGNTWTLVTGTPAGDQFKVTVYYSGENPASGLVLTNSNQAFVTIAGSGTKKWDFSELLGGTTNTFSDSTQKTYTITLTGS